MGGSESFSFIGARAVSLASLASLTLAGSGI
jgi:hypothetical protein